MLASSILAASLAAQRVPGQTWEWFLICLGGFLLFLALVAGAAGLSKSREDRREGRSQPRRERRTT